MCGGKPLCRDDDVGLHFEKLRAKPCSQTAERSDDLIRRKKNSVPITDFAYPGCITLRGNDTPPACLNRLHQNHGHGARVLVQNLSFELAKQRLCELLFGFVFWSTVSSRI